MSVSSPKVVKCVYYVNRNGSVTFKTKSSPITVNSDIYIIGGSSELPMWLTGCFLVTFFGRWWGAVRIHGNTQILRVTYGNRLPCITVWRGHYCVESHYRVEGTLLCGEPLPCGGDITMWRAITVWRGHYHVEGTFPCGEPLPCGGGITVWRGHSHVESHYRVEGTLPCGGDITVWRGHYRVESHYRVEGTFTSGTSHQSEILHSLIFYIIGSSSTQC